MCWHVGAVQAQPGDFGGPCAHEIQFHGGPHLLQLRGHCFWLSSCGFSKCPRQSFKGKGLLRTAVSNMGGWLPCGHLGSGMGWLLPLDGPGGALEEAGVAAPPTPLQTGDRHLVRVPLIIRLKRTLGWADRSPTGSQVVCFFRGGSRAGGREWEMDRFFHRGGSMWTRRK